MRVRTKTLDEWKAFVQSRWPIEWWGYTTSKPNGMLLYATLVPSMRVELRIWHSDVQARYNEKPYRSFANVPEALTAMRDEIHQMALALLKATS